MIRVVIAPTFDDFRERARELLARGTAPENVTFEPAEPGAQTALWAAQDPVEGAARRQPRRPVVLPRRFLQLARLASFHRERERFSLLYRIAFRIQLGERSLLDVPSDPDVLRLAAYVRAVERAVHHAHAFVRFRRIELADGERFVAWYAPEHPVLRLAAPFFRDRFPGMIWTIVTPDESVAWDGRALAFGPGAPRSAAPSSDELEQLFCDYYSAIFNPARLNLSLLRSHLPPRHWSTLPEARVLSALGRAAPERLLRMQREEPSAALPLVDPRASLNELRVAASRCAACPLAERATQTVFGEGPREARIMLVGEQPGDEEDRAGRPFMGPAGQVLDAALRDAGLSRDELYVTNAVKHFKWKAEGPRRLHDRPRPGEVRACRAWLDAEIARVKPRAIVCLGVTAAESFLGSRFSAHRYRGRWFETPWARGWMATYHPAAVLRARDEAERSNRFDELVRHLSTARAFVSAGEQDAAATSPAPLPVPLGVLDASE